MRSIPLSVLIVDDDASFREALAIFLELEGCKVSSAGCAEDARQLADSSPVDIAFIDCDLGDESGLDLLEYLCLLPDPPRAVLVTGDGSDRTRRGALQRGAEAIIRKPVDTQRVRRVLWQRQD